MLCLCGRPVLQVDRSNVGTPPLLDADVSPFGIWTVDQDGNGGRLTVQDVWDGRRGHHRHECPATETAEATLFGVTG